MGKGTCADPIQPLHSVLPGCEEKPSAFPILGVQKVISVPLVTKTAASTTYKVGGFVAPSDGWYIKEIHVGAMVTPNYASTTLAVDNYDASGNAARNVLAATNENLETLTALEGTKLTLSTTEANRYMDEGDVLNFTVAVGASETTPGEGIVATVVLLGPEID